MVVDTQTIQKIYLRLIEAAKMPNEIIYYEEIIRMAQIGHLSGGAFDGALWKVLEDVNKLDQIQDPQRPILSSLVISKDTNLPGSGFFTLARKYGRLQGRGKAEEERFWLRELQLLRNYWQASSETFFKGILITRNAIEAAIHKFDSDHVQANDYNEWLNKDGYKFALKLNDKLYPPKYILSIAANIHVSEFSGGKETNDILQQLGFSIIDKPNITEAQTQNTYLLIWNPSKFTWSDLQEYRNSIELGFRPQVRWSCGNTQNIRIGDRVFLMCLGQKGTVQGIAASGHVTKRPFIDANWNADSESLSAWYVEFEPDVLLNPQADPLLDPSQLTTQFNWRPQRSGTLIPSKFADDLEHIWLRHIQRPIVKGESISQIYREGARVLTTSFRYERDPQAREACIRHYGTSCTVCDFNFGTMFGDIGNGFIHVHHLTPISEHGEDYLIDPIRDLRPVCPNCHAMLHRKNPPYSIEELQHFVQKTLKSHNS